MTRACTSLAALALLLCSCEGDIDGKLPPDTEPPDPPCEGEGCPCAADADCTLATSCRRERGDPLTPGHCAALDPARRDPGERCASDEACQSALCRAGVCAELCTASCPSGATCVPTSDGGSTVGTCVLDLVRPDALYGPFDASAEGVWVSFTVPPDTASFTVVAQAAPAAGRVGFAELEGPQGTLFLRDADPSDLTAVGVPYPGANALVVPASDSAQAQPQAGTYRARVALYETSDFTTYTPVAGRLDEVRVVLEPEEERGGALELSLYFSPGVGVNVATGLADPFVTSMVGRLRELLRGSGGAVGRVSVAALPASLDTVSDMDVVRGACAAHAAPGELGASVSVLVVNDLTFAGGVAGGTPGPVSVAHSPGSCVLVGAQASARATGTVLAHELGHFLGLTHSSQIIYDTALSQYRLLGHDKVSDTPECPTNTGLASCPDYGNLMFPFFPLEGLSLTAAQRDLAQRSPLFYELPRESCAPRSAFDVTGLLATGGTTSGSANLDSGSCGGDGGSDRHYVYALHQAASALEVEVRGQGFAPVIYVRSADCAAELGCAVASGNVALVTLNAPAPGRYVVTVDSSTATGGAYELEVREK